MKRIIVVVFILSCMAGAFAYLYFRSADPVVQAQLPVIKQTLPPLKPLVQQENGTFVRGDCTYLSREAADEGCRCIWAINRQGYKYLHCKGC